MQFAPAIGVRVKVVTLPNTAVRFVPRRPFTPYDPTALRTGRTALPAIFSFSCCTVTARADAWISGRSASATRLARELAEENLRNQQKRHAVGMATTKDLLD